MSATLGATRRLCRARQRFGFRITAVALAAAAAILLELTSDDGARAQTPESPPDAPSATARPAAGIAYTVTIDVAGGEEPLTREIENASNLRALSAEAPAGPVGLVRRAAADIPRFQAALFAEGYYGALIDVRIAGVPATEPRAIDAAAAAALRGPVPVTVRIEPGRQFVFGPIVLADAATGRPPPPLPIDPATLGIRTGEPARARLVLEAETRLVDAMQDLGYPFAAVPRREAIADHATGTLDLTFYLAPGRYAVMGPVAVRGASEVDAEFIARQAGVVPGTPYSRAEIARIRDEMNRLGVFRSVRIVEGEEIGPDGQIPIIIEVEERKMRFVGLGAAYSSTEGSTVSGYWGHRNLFGRAESLRIEGEVSRLFSNSVTDLQYIAKATFEKPGVYRNNDDLLVEARAFRQVPEAYESRGFGGNVAWRRRFTDRLEGRIGAEAERSRITDAFGTRDYTLVGIPISLSYDSTDSKLDPTEGFRATGQIEPFPEFLGSTVGMTIVKGAVSAYHAIDDAKRFIVAGRVAAGTIDGPNVAIIPADRRFYAGGGGSIRGYAYQGVSPRLPNGQIIGGKSLFEASLEMRMKVTDTIGIVPFLDMGGAFASSTPDFGSDMKFSAGLGLRYYTAIGPLRLDVAVPLEKGPYDPSLAVYVGLGQSF